MAREAASSGTPRAPARRWRPLASVRARITAAAVVVVAFALTVAAATLVRLVEDSLVENLDEATEVVADDLAVKLETGALPEVVPVPGGADDSDLIVQVVDAERRVVVASENFLGFPPLTTEEPGEFRLRMTIDGLSIDPEEVFRLMGQRVVDASGNPLILYVATELEPVKETVNDVRRAIRVGAPLLLVLSGVAVWLLVGRALRPVEGIRRQVAEISDSGLDRRVPEPPVDDEVGRLARTMNAMLERLQRSAERQRRFVSDASHELRSPLTTTRTTLEVALAHPETTTLEAAATDLLAENERMERLVTDLLFLARGDERRAYSAPGPVDLDDVVAQEVARVRSRGGVVIDATDVHPVQVQAPSGHLERVVRNLLENAERHASSAVAVSVSAAGDGAVTLTVADDGPGIAPDDRERIFDRFVRLEESRSRGEGGAGLGLAISREIVVAHGGSITVEDAPGGGARFVVHLPAPHPSQHAPPRQVKTPEDSPT